MVRLVLILYISGLFSCTEKEPTCFDTNCADYTSQEAAQADFESNPECRNDLDWDNDRIACERYFNSNTGGSNSNGGGNGCPSTANCGCSNKKKSECVSSCCQWVVGTGCKCK